MAVSNNPPLPASGNNPPAQPKYWTEKRRELKRWLDRYPPLAALYEGTLTVLYEDKFPAKIRFVAHGVREIINSLPDYVVGPQRRERLDYRQRLDEIYLLWKEAGLPLALSAPMIEPQEGIDIIPADEPLPRAIVEKVTALVNEHQATSERIKDKVYRLFEAVAPENKDAKKELRPIVEHWVDLGEWFVGEAHDPRKQVEVDEKELVRQFGLFEDSLGSLIGILFDKTLDTLDDILENTNG